MNPKIDPPGVEKHSEVRRAVASRGRAMILRPHAIGMRGVMRHDH